MASASSNNYDEPLEAKFEQWLSDKLKTSINDPDIDVAIFASYMLSTLTEDDTSDEDKSDAIRQFLQELNQNASFSEEAVLGEIVETWNSMKLEDKANEEQGLKKTNQENNPTDTILSMINKHKSQLVEAKKPNATRKEESATDNSGASSGATTSHKPAHDYTNYMQEESSDDEAVSRKPDDLFANTNLQEAQNRDKANREKLAEASKQQKEQSKKALIEQKQREIDKKKKAQQKVAKVERKR